jgi:hypothetical protein
MIKQSVRNILAMKSNDEVTLKDNEIDGSNRSTSNSPVPLVHPEIQNIKSYQSFASASDDLGSDNLSPEEEAVAIELSLRALLSFRLMALTLREEAKRFRAELREMTFDSDHEACKDTCSYIRYKINKIIGLNSALSKFANENALSILNPFADKNDLTETLNTHLRGLLKCIMKTKLDRITVSGPNSRKASAGIAAIYKLIAGLSPAAAAIADVTKVICDKIVQYDLNEKREKGSLWFEQLQCFIPVQSLYSYAVPRIVCIGEESSGKSSTLERIAEMSFFPTDRHLCTRMPIELKLRHQDISEIKEKSGSPHASSYVMMHLIRGPGSKLSDDVNNGPFSTEDVASKVKEWMFSIVDGNSQDSGRPVGVTDDRLVIELYSTRKMSTSSFSSFVIFFVVIYP